MRYTHIRSADLNLLACFQALIEERSVSKAATRLYLSQPGMSRVLDRLQDLFKDELLIRSAKGYEPTQRALRIYSQLDQVMPSIEMLLHENEFKPETSTESFKIAATDSVAVVLVPQLIKALARVAPGIQVRVSAVGAEVFHSLEKNEFDLAFWVNSAPKTLHYDVLYEEQLTCLVSLDFLLPKRRLTMANYLKHKHLVVSLEGVRPSVVDETLARLGLQRDVQLAIPYLFYASVGYILESTNWIATLPMRFARLLTRISKTRLLAPPKEFQSFSYIQVWHPRNDSDPCHKWLRGFISRLSSADRQPDGSGEPKGMMYDINSNA